MCFSATASFGSGTLLLASGTVTLRIARRPAERPYAAIPLLFAVQQLVEGVVWLSFSGPAWLNFTATQAYSLFSPRAVAGVYTPGGRAARARRTAPPRAIRLCDSGTGRGCIPAVQPAGDPDPGAPGGGHVDYQSPHFYIAASMTLYLQATTVSLLVSSHVWVKVFGALALGASFLSYIFYARWFISVWCFFAALLSVAVALHFVAPRSILHQRIPS